MVKLVSIYASYDYDTLYKLLKERTKNQNISHREMPTFDEHVTFVDSRPYLGWYYIMEGPVKVGAIYLTCKEEIGIFIFKTHKRKGYGSLALRELMYGWPGTRKLYANINPKNEASIEFFKKKGFKHLSSTYVLNRR